MTLNSSDIGEQDVVVVGAGMMGSAAAKYLAKEGLRTLLVGPQEADGSAIHGSHHDEARITRFSGPDPVWSELAAQSIERYPAIEADSGTAFHDPCGHLRCDLSAGHPDSALESARDILQKMPVDARLLDRDSLGAEFPYLCFQGDAVVHHEPGPAGIINPRKLVRAQQEIGIRHGLTRVHDVVESIQPQEGGFIVVSRHDRFFSQYVLVSAGSYTSLMDLTPRPVQLRVRPETVLLAEITGSQQDVLKHMPGIIWNFDHHPSIPFAYILPPVRYPDGRFYVKIGADHDKDVEASTVKDYDAYMRGEGSRHTAEGLRELLVQLIPDLESSRVRSKPCMLTYTSHGYPYIDEVSPGWFVAAGGCGKSAKSSDQIGYLASRMIAGKSWPGPFQRVSFAVS